MALIIGRKREIKLLEAIVASNKPEFLTIHGRRRVGKTFLIKTFMNTQKVIFFRVTGMKDAPLKKQIRHVTDEIGNVFYGEARLEVQKDWPETFLLLTDAIRKIKDNSTPIVLFFDEFPWMATKKSQLLQTLDHYWNHHWSEDKRIKLIICGSAASWIINKIVNNKGGLHNRITKNLRLEPFTLCDTKAYLSSMGVNLNNHHIINLYMITGGIPYYLAQVDKGLSATQIIGALAFSKDGLLLNEFNNLYSSLFEHSEGYIDLIRIIYEKRYGISQVEVIEKSKYFSKGGRIAKRLKELEEAGFIISFIPYQHKRRGIHYRLVDEYTVFYFYWIEPIYSKLKKSDLDGTYWESMQKLSAWKAWSGYAFEALCFKHLPQIRKALRLGSDAMVDSWRYSSKMIENDQGAQIDLLFDRNDEAITLCEIKYTKEPFIVDKQVIASLSEKERIFHKQTRTKKQLFWALISENGFRKTAYAEKLIASCVTADDLFVE